MDNHIIDKVASIHIANKKILSRQSKIKTNFISHVEKENMVKLI
ncbi:hypothetical protein [Sphingobacterium puteale]|nr:hypothetical protein [Sphingobacterium puteale]